METDADRLASIKGLGGQLVRSEHTEFWGIFGNAYESVLSGDRVETRAPILTCRTSDVEGLRKGTVLTIAEGDYKIVRVEPDPDGVPGWSVLRLGK